MKIVHCSDLHLGKKVSGKSEYVKRRYVDFFEAFENFIEKVESIKPDVCIIAGDIFDKKEINSDILTRTENLMNRLRSSVKKEIIAIEGNHDNSKNLEESWLKYLGDLGLIKLFYYNKEFKEKNYIKIEDVNFYPIGYPGFMVDEVLTETVEILDPSEKNIVIVHTGISGGTNTLPGLVSTRILDLFKDKVIYMAGGHIHSYSSYPKENPYFFVSGSLEFSNIQNEKSNDKGFILFDTDTKSYEFIKIEHRQRVKEKFYYSNINNIENEFEDFIKKLSLNSEEILIVNISIKSGDYINKDRLEEIAEKNGVFKIYILFSNISFTTDNENQIISDEVTISELEKNIINTWDKNKISSQEFEKFIQSFTELKNFSINSDSESFLNLFDKILEVDEKC